MVSKRYVIMPYSKQKEGIAKVLKDEGFIRSFEKINDENNKSSLKIFLKYVNGESVIHELTRISKPSRRHYEGVSRMTSVIGGLGVSILTTNLGLITDRKARELRVGGEVICHIW